MFKKAIEFIKKHKKPIIIISVSVISVAAIVTGIIVYLSSYDNLSVFSELGFTVLEKNNNDDGKRTVVLSSETEEITDENIVLARFAKDVFDKSDLSDTEIVFRSKKGVDIVTIPERTVSEQKTFPIYMEESLLEFKLLQDFSDSEKTVTELKITTYPQCYSIESEPANDKRTVNVKIISTPEYVDTDKVFIKNIFEKENDSGAAIYCYNVSYVTENGDIILLTSTDLSKGDEIVIENDNT